MLVTIFDINGKKELHYGIQEHAGIQGLIYDVSQKAVEIIFNCETHEIQSVIKTILETERKVSSTL